MASRVKISFVRLHRWDHAALFSVLHSAGPTLVDFPAEEIGSQIPLWTCDWEQAGFGHGSFGSGSFGWGQGGPTGGGFGHGRFGAGEFGYYNAVVEWTTPRTYPDGLHTFGIRLFSENGVSSSFIPQWQTLIASTPADPPALLFGGMTAGECRLRWIGGENL